MHLQVMNVTPEIATDWLSKNGKNRRYSQKHAEKIANAIRSGEWSLNGETICFDDQGRLLDGQHRLNAVVLSGQPIRVAVATGVSDPGAFETYDSVQRTRSADQIAEMKGVSNSRKVTAAARVVMSWECSKSISDFHKLIMNSQGFSPHELSNLAVEISDEVEHCHEMIGNKILRMTRVGSYILGMMVILNRINPVNTQCFFQKVQSGVVESPNDPALVYRDRMFGNNGSFRSERRWRIAAMAMTVKAWNAHKRGSTVANLRFRQEGDNPETFPAPIGGGKG